MVRHFLAALTVLLLPLGVSAEQTETERRAFEEFEQARRLFDAEDYLAAARHFEAAQELVPSASVHYNIARSYELANDYEVAAQHYRAFLDARAGNTTRRRQVQERLDAITTNLRWIDVTTVPTGATISVDGRERGVSPATLAVTRRSHIVEAHLNGATASHEVEAGHNLARIILTLDQGPTEPDNGTSQTGTSQNPPDGTTSTTSPGPQPDHPPGRRLGRLHPLWFVVSAGLAVGSAVALAVVGSEFIAKDDEYQALINSPSRNEEVEAAVREEGILLQQATTALWVTTGVLVLASVLVGVFTDWSVWASDRATARRPFRLSPAWGRGRASFVLSF